MFRNIPPWLCRFWAARARFRLQSPDARARDIELAGQVVVPANEVHHE
jgi:hypothetical protein